MKDAKGHGSDAHQAGVNRIEPAPIVGPARYAKNMMAVQTPSNDGLKTRAARLADAISNSRYSGRENAYIMSKSAADKFQKLHAQGWDAGYMKRDLYPPGTKRNAEAVACDLCCAANILEGEDIIQSTELEKLCVQLETAIRVGKSRDALDAVEAIRVLNAPCAP